MRSANACANGGTFEIKTSFLKGKDWKDAYDWEARKRRNTEEIKKMNEKIKEYPSLLKFFEKAIKDMEKENKFSCWTFSSSCKSHEEQVKGVVLHEVGHILADQKFGQINGKYYCADYVASMSNPQYQAKDKIAGIFKKAKKSGDIYNISMYASTNANEFFAECFCVMEMGKRLPDYIEEAVKEVLKL